MTDASDEMPEILDLPIGLDATGVRREFDSLGEVEVPANRYWGAQTQRSLAHFSIGSDRMPKEVYHAYAYVRKGRGGGQYPGGSVAGLEGRPDRAGVRRDDHGRLDQESRCMCGRPDQGTQSNVTRSRI